MKRYFTFLVKILHKTSKILLKNKILDIEETKNNKKDEILLVAYKMEVSG